MKRWDHSVEKIGDFFFVSIILCETRDLKTLSLNDMERIGQVISPQPE